MHSTLNRSDSARTRCCAACSFRRCSGMSVSDDADRNASIVVLLLPDEELPKLRPGCHAGAVTAAFTEVRGFAVKAAVNVVSGDVEAFGAFGLCGFDRCGYLRFSEVVSACAVRRLGAVPGAYCGLGGV